MMLKPRVYCIFCFQNGGECLRAYVSVALEQIAQWQDEQGHSGLWYVMQVVSQLLDPRTSEFTAAFVGRLVSTLISKAGRELGENLDQILRAILSKMQQAETLSVMQVMNKSLSVRYSHCMYFWELTIFYFNFFSFFFFSH